MLSNTDHIPIYPSRGNYAIIKQKLDIANICVFLLNRKMKALSNKFQEDNMKLVEYKSNTEQVMRVAFEAMAKANFLAIDFKPIKIMDMEKADIDMEIRKECTAGICTSVFKLNIMEPNSCPYTGLSRGGEQVDYIRNCFQDVIKVLCTVATLEFSMKTIKNALSEAKSRLNNLEYIFIPRLKNTLNYIADEFNELERDEIYRMKCATAKQRQQVISILQLRKKHIEIEKLKARNLREIDYKTDSSEDEKRRGPPQQSSEEIALRQLARDKANLQAERINKRHRKKLWLQHRDEKKLKEELSQLPEAYAAEMLIDAQEVSKPNYSYFDSDDDQEDAQKEEEGEEEEEEEEVLESNKELLKGYLKRFMKKK